MSLVHDRDSAETNEVCSVCSVCVPVYETMWRSVESVLCAVFDPPLSHSPHISFTPEVPKDKLNFDQVSHIRCCWGHWLDWPLAGRKGMWGEGEGGVPGGWGLDKTLLGPLLSGRKCRPLHGSVNCHQVRDTVVTFSEEQGHRAEKKLYIDL